MKALLLRLTWLLAPVLLTACAYDDGYYGPPAAYDYGYGYGYGYYDPGCGWPYDCDDWHHHHYRHHHGDGDEDNDSGQHRYHGGVQGGRPRFDPNRQAGDFPHHQEQQNPRNAEPAGPGRARPPASPNPYLIPQPRDSKN